MGILEDYMRQQEAARAAAQKQAQQDALLAAGMSLLGTRKGRELEGLGRAGLLGLATARNTAIPEGPSLRDMLALQQYEQQQQERAATQAEQQAMRGAATASIVGGSPEMGPPTPAGGMQPATPGQFDPAQYVQRLYQMGRVNEAMAVEKQYAKPPKKLKDVKTLMQGGKRVTVNFYDDGSQEVLPFDPDAEKLHFADAGGTAGVGLDPFTGKPVSAGITKTMTQAERDASARGWAGINLQRDAAKREAGVGGKPQLVDGQWMYPPTPEFPNGRVVTPEGQQPGAVKRAANSKMALEVVDNVEKIIDQSTGSYGGAAIDLLARSVGVATPGANASARLKVLEAALIMNQPRMEGPQSDRDALLYKQAAGQIGDATVPNAQKKAAVAEIRRIHRQYGGIAAGASGGWSAVEVK